MSYEDSIRAKRGSDVKNNIALGKVVTYKVFDIFCTVEKGDDFGVQSAASLVFGGTNRVILTMKHGLIADESYCTEDFLKRFKEWKES